MRALTVTSICIASFLLGYLARGWADEGTADPIAQGDGQFQEAEYRLVAVEDYDRGGVDDQEGPFPEGIEYRLVDAIPERFKLSQDGSIEWSGSHPAGQPLSRDAVIADRRGRGRITLASAPGGDLYAVTFYVVAKGTTLGYEVLAVPRRGRFGSRGELRVYSQDETLVYQRARD